MKGFQTTEKPTILIDTASRAATKLELNLAAYACKWWEAKPLAVKEFMQLARNSRRQLGELVALVEVHNPHSNYFTVKHYRFLKKTDIIDLKLVDDSDFEDIVSDKEFLAVFHMQSVQAFVKAIVSFKGSPRNIRLELFN